MTTHEGVGINVTVNGESRDAIIDVRETLVDFIRVDLGLTGTHVGCRTGDCGACTVTVDGEVVKSCLALGVSADKAEIRTIEGFAESSEHLSIIQTAFWEEFGFQCGYCLPGMLFCTEELLKKNPDPSEAEIREAIDGNLCRCTGYHGIIRAVRRAAEETSQAQREKDELRDEEVWARPGERVDRALRGRESES
ncbi:(2Fe-2S)-binding protein [Homoserinimonas sp. OAct 916]|uniref:(2Fe-2S)-binding protein n=1 Tax=Homoserinimonas sp. OAct 916 TaxID=2211450 RepID=UPI000DBE16F4|nr:(2Fe-2S)-binding protein [Homoserinimonas sp. OAct 916]